MKKNKPLSSQEKRIILDKGTEAPFSGKYWNHNAQGVYKCRLCGAGLYKSESKFDSGSGWPSFDEEILGAVARKKDADRMRTEILCAECGAHLGHVFSGEGFTQKNTRHCVNSASIGFESDEKAQKAVFAAGCFWGVEHGFGKAPGVLSARSGYTGGDAPDPSYEQVCTGATGHYEAVEVVFDGHETSYEELLKLFFNMHDFSRGDGQGPDKGPQYRSAVFYDSQKQKLAAEKIIAELKDKGCHVATRVLPLEKFYPAEEHHQNYYQKRGLCPGCGAGKKIL